LYSFKNMVHALPMRHDRENDILAGVSLHNHLHKRLHRRASTAVVRGQPEAILPPIEITAAPLPDRRK